MKEVILNDKCALCNHKECHDGEHFCNQAMKENSFYKNAKLYKGLEVIQRPAYEELEKENKTISRKANEAIADKLLITAKYNEVLNDLNQENDKLQKKNAELKADNDARKFAMAMSEKVEKQLRNENEKLKEKCNSLQELVTYYQTNFCQE